ncbi:hypothetical protein GCM10022199_16840 [Marihabitans asiaticum]|uniref:Uncharacterized protein n=1 Tax=Marihabitans asiaticum TaxID=415218 RepID=A0A560W7N7_9MICO|nr:hypothetical protein [Marihabitans asiaticum]TWD13633.1 hypothetical protein FB557_2260 [Marihabitans asiaticum]
MSRHPFAFDPAYRLPALAFAITPRTAWVDVADDELRVRYGPWSLRTPLSNITGTQLTGGFAFVKTAGPPHLSFADRGISFATNGREALCVTFATPVKGIDPTGRITHPGATMTVEDPMALRADLGW